MILLIHKDEVVTEVIDLNTNKPINSTIKKPIKALFDLAIAHKECILIWCHKSQKKYLKIEEIKVAFKLKNMMLSYSENQYLPEQIGYVEDSPFLKVNKDVKYPTWLMSSNVGAIYGSQLLKFKNQIGLNESFSFVLNSIAKLGIPNGLLCYSEPKLLNGKGMPIIESKASILELLKFVKGHYKSIWSFLMLINFIINERKIPLLSFLRTIFIKKRNLSVDFDLELIEDKEINFEFTVDVIIPTLGRRTHLYNFLIDLSSQSQLPNQVIIIEQNGDVNSTSDLDFISNKTWPFKISHEFTHQTGACNARNLALVKVNSNYVFFADDDIRIKPNHIELTIKKMVNYKFGAVTLSCLQKKAVKIHNQTLQWTTFGSGCSFVKSEYLKDLRFDMSYEFCFGEDADFGIQLRNKGVDIIYLPEPEIEHLKAPIGGFRTSFKHKWTVQGYKPKPSPTITLYKLKHQTYQQLCGYKLVLFFKYYRVQLIKNPFKYFKTFKEQWRQSIFWANKLKNNLQ